MLHSWVTHLIIGGGGEGGESFGETIGYFHLGGGGGIGRLGQVGAFTGYQARMRTEKQVYRMQRLTPLWMVQRAVSILLYSHEILNNIYIEMSSRVY
jgi:hypothetical protein